MMCENCDSKGYVKEKLPTDIKDRACRLIMCQSCKGVGSILEAALRPLNMTVEQYYKERTNANVAV